MMLRTPAPEPHDAMTVWTPEPSWDPLRSGSLVDRDSYVLSGWAFDFGDPTRPGNRHLARHPVRSRLKRLKRLKQKEFHLS